MTEVIGHSSIALAFDVWNHEKAATGLRAIVKLITSAAISILCAVMIFGKKEFNLQMIVDFGFWLMTIGCASAPEHLKVLEEFCDYTTEKNREAAVAKRLARVEIAYAVYVEKKDEAE